MMNSRPSSPEFNLEPAEFDELQQNREKNAKLRAIVEDVGPRVYRLKLDGGDEVNFITFGCQGSGDEKQHATSNFLNQTIATQDKKPSFILILGDNIYDYGVSSTQDPGFKECFYDVYGNPNLKEVADLPCFLVLGNHDGNLHSQSWRMYQHTPGEETEMYEVMHTYDAAPEEYQQLYKQEELDVKQVPKWNMPYYYYSIIAGDLQIFCLDSNRYVKDLLIAELSGEPDPNNQAVWLKREFEKTRAAGRRTAVAMHHPLYTSGKRAFPEKHDSGHYLTETQIRSINNIMHTDTTSYNQLIANGFKHQGIHFDMVFVAHDHFLSFYNDKKGPDDNNYLCQLTLGGGGGELQSRESFVGHPEVASHLKQNGFCIVKYQASQPDHFDYHVYSVKGHHLHYRNDQRHAVRQPSQDEQVEKLRQAVLDACDGFLVRLRHNELLHMQPGAGKQPEEASTLYRFYSLGKWGVSQAAKAAKNYLAPDATKKEIIAVHDLIAYFNQPKLPSLGVCINKFNGFLNPLYAEQVTESSFVRQLDVKLYNDYGIDLNHLLAACEESSQSVLTV